MLYGRPSCTVSYIRRVGTDPDLVLKLTKQKIERRSLKVAMNCAFLILFFFTSAICSAFGLSKDWANISGLQILLEFIDLAVCIVGMCIGGYGLFLSMQTDFKPVEIYKGVSLYFGGFYCVLFVAKVLIEGQNKSDILGLFECRETIGALSCYTLILLALIFCIAKFVMQVKRFGTDLVQLNAHTIPLLNVKSVLGKV